MVQVLGPRYTYGRSGWSSWLLTVDSALAVVDMWEVNRQMEDLSLFQAAFSIHLKKKIFYFHPFTSPKPQLPFL